MTQQASVELVTADLLEQWQHDAANLLQVLIGVKQVFNHVPAAAIETAAAALSLPRAHIEGVIGFYTFLQLQPRGDYDLLFSDNIIEQMLGSRELAERLGQRLVIAPGASGGSGRVSLDFTSCTGMGDQGPAALVNGRAVTRLTAQRVDEIAALIAREQPLSAWPGELFAVDENIRRRDLLLDNPLSQGEALRAVIERGAQQVLDELDDAGLRGRGGAGFRTALKWRLCREAAADERVVVCNADEGEPGTFKDRVLLQAYAESLIEGMTL